MGGSMTVPDIVLADAGVMITGPLSADAMNVGTDPQTPGAAAFSVSQAGDIVGVGTLGVRQTLTVEGMVRTTDVLIGPAGETPTGSLSTALGELAALSAAVQNISEALAKSNIPVGGTGSGGPSAG